MGKFRISDIHVDAMDYMGEEVTRIYGGVEPLYVVYRTRSRVAVQFADDDAVAATQLAQLRPLNLLRGQINALIDGWRYEQGDKNGRCAEHYDRRVADALLTALQGDVPVATQQLNQVRDDIICQRKAIGRFWYLMTAGIAAAGFLLLTWILSSAGIARLNSFSTVWTAGAGGTLGALFSILTGMRNRTILVDLRQRDNNIDACLRVATGAVSGGVLVSLLISGLVTNSLIRTGAFGVEAHAGGPSSITPELLTYVVGFLAGFAERLVPDLLGNVKLGLEEQSGQPPTPPVAPAPPAPPPPPPPAADNQPDADSPDPDGQPDPNTAPGDIDPPDPDAGPGDADPPDPDATGQGDADPPDPDATGSAPPSPSAPQR